jgi:homoserine dehydrogenase
VPNMRIIMIGFGSVGKAFVEIVNTRSGMLRKSYGITPKVVAIVDRGGALVNQQGVDFQEAISARLSSGSVAGHNTLGRKGTTALTVIDSVEADVLLELTPTTLPDGEPGLTHIESAIKKGLNIITTNKGPLAAAMPSLLELARYQRVCLRFSGAVGGGTPFLNFAKECLPGCRIESIEGILNGTTNHILTRMLDVGMTLNEALREAQDAGYAEADPSYDINGLDTASKLVIMANWIMERRVSIRDVDVEGISNVSIEDVQNAKRSEKAIKLIGLINDSEISVHPRALSFENPLCVKGSLNAVVFNTDLAGPITVTGRGAGGTETAGAVLRDLINIKKALLRSGDT